MGRGVLWRLPRPVRGLQWRQMSTRGGADLLVPNCRGLRDLPLRLLQKRAGWVGAAGGSQPPSARSGTNWCTKEGSLVGASSSEPCLKGLTAGDLAGPSRKGPTGPTAATSGRLKHQGLAPRRTRASQAGDPAPLCCSLLLAPQLKVEAWRSQRRAETLCSPLWVLQTVGQT